ncbi:MAG TPA: SUMF1/EgtB/PvdO family nonheme iron enzyme, partial [Gemmataceae bacterium]|nr:SUMF1/EgtB/PvdO family nonheme iron enzyme [Gemmataceae bacterium]
FDKPTNDLSSTQANFDGRFPDGKGDKGPCLERPVKVGSYAPNKLGLYDMHGNVWQFCEDRNDPMGLFRVYRGGCYSDVGSLCRAANRDRNAPTPRFISIGVRLARVPSGGK